MRTVCRVSATLRSDGKPVDWEGMRTMSKSKSNGVDPTDLVARYGADSIRVFMMFKAPPEDTLEWSDDGVEGSARFLRRLWRMVWEHLEKGPLASAPRQELIALSPAQREMRRMAHATLVEGDGRLRPSARVQHGDRCGHGAHERARRSSTMPVEQGRAVRHEALELIVQMLAPIAPHVCHVLWRELGHTDRADRPSVAAARSAGAGPGPRRDRRAGERQAARAQVEVGASANNDEISAAALADATVQKWIEGKPVRKVIVPPGGKLVNVVV